MKWNPPLVREGTDWTRSHSGLSLKEMPEGVNEKREVESQSLQNKCLVGQNQTKTKQNNKNYFLSLPMNRIFIKEKKGRRNKRKGGRDIRIQRRKIRNKLCKSIWWVSCLRFIHYRWLQFPLKSRYVWKEDRTRVGWRGAWISSFPWKWRFGCFCSFSLGSQCLTNSVDGWWQVCSLERKALNTLECRPQSLCE